MELYSHWRGLEEGHERMVCITGAGQLIIRVVGTGHGGHVAGGELQVRVIMGRPHARSGHDGTEPVTPRSGCSRQTGGCQEPVRSRRY